MTSKRKRKTKQAVAEEAVPATAPTPAPTPAPRRELTEEEREFLNALTNLVTAAQELSYALAAVDVETLGDSQELKEILETARNVVKAVWRFHRLVKTRMGRA
ncbi:MAG: hypothetical protein DRJ67_08150 [Thermoprotei archaeon]|nr:MAG: hypothetical protein DRJ67_08150 [Thermoprotei archaeon]